MLIAVSSLDIAGFFMQITYLFASTHICHSQPIWAAATET